MKDEAKPTLVHTPPNYLPQIDKIWAVLSVDEGGEGVVAVPMLNGNGMLPLIAADEARLNDIVKMARAAGSVTGKKMRLVRFNHREVVGDIEP